jgi:hypothetical protein
MLAGTVVDVVEDVQVVGQELHRRDHHRAVAGSGELRASVLSPALGRHPRAGISGTRHP